MNSSTILNRLHAAAYRHICANSLQVVGRDGRSFVCVEALLADHALARLLAELDTPPLKHAEACAARKSKVAECDCHVAATASRIEKGEADALC